MVGGTSTRHNSQLWLSPSFEAMCRWVLQHLKAPGVDLVGVRGWSGVGRRWVLRHAVEMLVGGGGDGVVGTTRTTSNNIDGDPPSFPHILRLPRLEDETEIRRRLQEMLRYERNEAGEPFGGDWWAPLASPQHATLVVIEQDLRRELMDPENILGRGRFSPFSLDYNLKIVATVATVADDKPGFVVSDSFSSLAEEEAWELLRHEADEMADELCREQQLPFFLTGDAIMEYCFLYATLFKDYDTTRIPPYWWCEGRHAARPSTTAAAPAAATSTSSSTTPSRNITYNEHLDMFHLLLAKFKQRSMADDYQRIKKGLRSKVRTIATTLYQSPPSRIRKKGRFMTEISMNLKELPEGMQRWDQQGITRVSLDNNQIQQLEYGFFPPVLLPPPGCGHDTTMSNIISPPKCENLSTLILSHNPLRAGIQDDFFQGMIMPNLRVLDLSFCTRLQVLPTSVTRLPNLRFLNLQGCTYLLTISPCLERGFPNLEILDIRECTLRRMTTASFRQVPNLRLLVTNSRSLYDIEVLDLSCTKIESLPKLRGSVGEEKFTRLDLLNTKHLSTANWPKFTRMPTTINWDQCGGCTAITPYSGAIGGHLRMCVQDPEIFRSLEKDHALWCQPFQEFHINVHPCTKQTQQHPHSVNRPIADLSPYHHHNHHPHRKYPPSPYTNLNLSSTRRKQGQQDDRDQYCNNDDPRTTNWRYLHICGVSKPFTSPMVGVLPNMHSLQLCNHDSVKLLPIVHPMELKTCHVVKCPSMETVFYGANPPTSELAHLESINLVHLRRLETLYKGYFSLEESFSRLRSVYVDNCSRMITVFSSTPRIILFPQLEKLVIKSCGKLSEVFGRGATGSTVAPMLSDLHLWDLPELRNVCDGCLPSLRTLQLRGCAKLRALPLPSVDSEGKPFKLNITAERKWWENLNEANKKRIIFKPWSPWTSRS